MPTHRLRRRARPRRASTFFAFALLAFAVLAAATARRARAEAPAPAPRAADAKPADTKAADAKPAAPKSSDGPPKTEAEKYEEAYVEARLRKNHLRREANPEGKLIEDIIIEVEEVFDRKDLGLIAKVPILGIAPKIANPLHARTRRYIVARELLFEVGRPFKKAIVEETERNLRALVILAIARIVPCQGTAPNTVRILIATKDLWSLRVETDFLASAGRLDFLRLNVVERNLAGRNLIVAGTLTMSRDELAVGQAFYDPRLFGSRIFLDQSASLIFGRGGRGIEGGTSHLEVGQPLYSLASKWSFNVATDLSVSVTRAYRGNDFYRCFPGASPTSSILCDNDITGSAQRAALLGRWNSLTPIYESRLATASAGAVRRYGDAIKHDISFGYGLRHAAYNLIPGYPEQGAATAPMLDAVRSTFLPRSEDASYVYAGYRTFDTRFTTLKNVAVFALTEDFQYGHDVRFVARWADKVFGVDNNYLELDGSAQYRWLLGGSDLFTLAGRAQTRLAGTNVLNNRFTFVAQNISPILGIGRLIFQASAIFRFDDQDNLRSTLGGNSGLRGYDSDFYRGRHMVNLHLEYRSFPIDVLTVQVGFAGFWDAGHAADEVSKLKLRHSIGAGLRLFFPQINRMVMRVDFGVPLSDGGPGGLAQMLSFSFDQAF